MVSVSIDELGARTREFVERASAGEAITITEEGKAVAELRPLLPRGVPTAELIEEWKSLPPIDPVAFRRDIDELLDMSL
jgi:prevent-host-death family protein